ncbi:ribbon-helix-helix domain-containing protein [bacterium]|nr:ribbon-helix-helix domain-containing protein [bacterium]
MAVRQKSDSNSGNTKKPRVQTILPEPLLAKLEAHATEQGVSVSEATRDIIRDFFAIREAAGIPIEKRLTPTTDGDKSERLLQLIELGKAAGII